MVSATTLSRLAYKSKGGTKFYFYRTIAFLNRFLLLREEQRHGFFRDSTPLIVLVWERKNKLEIIFTLVCAGVIIFLKRVIVSKVFLVGCAVVCWQY